VHVSIKQLAVVALFVAPFALFPQMVVRTAAAQSAVPSGGTIAAWTAIASTGVIDETDMNKVNFGIDGSATIKSTISSTSARIRYNITATEDITRGGTPGQPLSFGIVARDNGPHAHVKATLKAIGLRAGGVARTLMVWDSDNFPSNDGFVRSDFPSFKDGGDVVGSLGFFNDGYVIEVDLIKTAADGNPGLRGLTLYHYQP